MELSKMRTKIEKYSGDADTYFAFNGGAGVFDQNCRCIATVLDESGIPMTGVKVTNMRPDSQYECLETNGLGQVEFWFGPGAKFWEPNEGPHRVYVGEGTQVLGDMVRGMGLPDGHHAEYNIAFRKVKRTVEPPVDPEDPPQTNRGCVFAIMAFLWKLLFKEDVFKW